MPLGKPPTPTSLMWPGRRLATPTLTGPCNACSSHAHKVADGVVLPLDDKAACVGHFRVWLEGHPAVQPRGRAEKWRQAGGGSRDEERGVAKMQQITGDFDMLMKI